MSIITIQCRLVAPEETGYHLWQLMSQLNTPLINELLEPIPKEKDFDIWKDKSKLPAGTIKKLCEPLKKKYNGQPARFYTSAILLVEYIYKAWFKLQQKRKWKLEGHRRWLEILKSDRELTEYCDCSRETLINKAKELLTTYLTMQSLFDAYDRIKSKKNKLEIAAITYLLKNKRKIPKKEENIETFTKRYHQTEIKIARLTEQIESSYPKGRDLTGQKWLDTLIKATTTAPEDNIQAKIWQDTLLKKTKSVPFPVNYETNEDLVWSKNEKGRLCVRFNGLGKKYTFEIYCDKRHLKWFQRFYEDQQVKKSSKNQHSTALFTLRSGRIAWKEGKAKGEPWNVHHLRLFCSLDTRFWTAEGTEIVRQEKVEDIIKKINSTKEKGDLTKQQQTFLKSKNTSLARIKNSFPRPSKPLYQGRSEILVGVAMGLQKPATIAVIDAARNKTILYRSVKQLLGKNYRLLNILRKEKKIQSKRRHTAQKKDAHNKFGTSELGQYIDYLFAKAIVELANAYQAGSIVIPKLGDIREIVQAEIQALAETKIPGSLKGQSQYAKQYRVNIHQWSYGRLINNIKTKANLVGIAIEEAKQPLRVSPQKQAEILAFEAYKSRNQ